MSIKGSKITFWSNKEIKIIKNFKVSSIIKNNLLPNRTSGAIRGQRAFLINQGAKMWNRKYDPNSPEILIKNTAKMGSKKTEKSNFFWSKEEDNIIKNNDFDTAFSVLTSAPYNRKPSGVRVRVNKLGFTTKTTKSKLGRPVGSFKTTEFKSSSNDLNFRLHGVDVVIAADMTKKVLITKDRIEILNK